MGAFTAACDFSIKSVIKGAVGINRGCERKTVISPGTQEAWVKTNHFSRDDACFFSKHGYNYSTIIVFSFSFRVHFCSCLRSLHFLHFFIHVNC